MRLIDLGTFYEIVRRSQKEGHEIYPEYYDDVLSDMPVIDAIPVEWIEEWGRQNGMSESMSLSVMIEDWRKEHE